ncbi:hypothetical protein BDR04DRAFT_1232372 [Suillus decipiens]|nr:hypothetical protein BDR04DRAFT_1232372 [Suillus decipiens]
MSPPPTATKQTVLTGFTTTTDTENVLKQLRAAAALAVKKQQEAEEASRRAGEDLQRAEEEAKAKAEEQIQRSEIEKKLTVVEKTGAEHTRRCTACTKARFYTPCTFSATNSSITTCDRCRRWKVACTFPGEAEKSKKKRKRTMDEVESPRRGKSKKSRHYSLSPSPIEIEEEADETMPAISAPQMLADKIGQLTDLVGYVNNAMVEGFAAHRKELHQMVTTLNDLLQCREELAINESIKQE